MKIVVGENDPLIAVGGHGSGFALPVSTRLIASSTSPSTMRKLARPLAT
jgi:hypothetical protein